MAIVEAQDVLDFWFNEENEDDWFQSTDEFDQEIADRFMATWEAACEGLLYPWRVTVEGRVAEIIVLDQFSRNLMRGDARSYTQDSMALVLAQELEALPEFAELPQDYKVFALMPFMHAESRGIQDLSVKLFDKYDLDDNMEYALGHKEIIDEWGYYPHRKQELGLELSADEEAFLSEDGNAY